MIFIGAFSRYALQSFVPNTGTKGFPLLSGLGLLLRQQKLQANPEPFCF